MAVYEVEGPDGGVYEIEVPDEYTEDQVMAAAQQQFAGMRQQGSPTASNASRVQQTSYADPDKKRDAALRREFAPTVGMSGYERFTAGMGKSAYDTARGLGQLAGVVSDEDVAESRRLDAPLMQTGSGVAGNITGYGAQIIAPGGLAGATAKTAASMGLARTAQAANAARSAALPASFTGNVTQGAALGFAQPVVEGESRLQNAALGSAGGAVGFAIPGLVRGTKAALIDPLTDKGNERILARSLMASAENPATLRNPTAPNLPGYQPTLAEATLDPGIAQLQRALTNTSPSVANALSNARSGNNLARVKALEGLTPSVADATAARGAATAPLYDAARAGSAPIDDEFKALMSRPSIKEGLRQAKKIAQEMGEKIPAKVEQYTGAHLQYVDQALSDQISKAKRAGANGEVRRLMDTQAELRGWLEKSIPEYGQAQQQFRTMSREVDQAKIGRQILRSGSSNTADLATGAPVLRPDATKGAIKNIERTAAAARVKGDPRSIMTQQQMDTLGAVDNSLDRAAFAETAARAGGSTTAQNLAGMNALAQLGLPSGVLNLGPVGRLAGILDTAFKVAGVPERLQVRLAQIITNPQETQRIIMALPENDQRIVLRALNVITSQQAGARVGVSASQSR